MGTFAMVTPVSPFPNAIGNNFNTFTARIDVSPKSLPIVQGYSLEAGKKIRLEAVGEFSTTGTPTLSLGFYIGTAAAAITTVIAENTAVATGSAAASWSWHMEWFGQCVLDGVAGSVVGSGRLFLGTSLTAMSVIPIPSTLALRTIVWDTTIARAIGVCATWGTNSVSNNVRTYSHSAVVFN